MPETLSSKLPALLIIDFSAATPCVKIADACCKAGYSILAACGQDDASSISIARQSGYDIIEADKTHQLRLGLEYYALTYKMLPGVIVLEAEGGYCLDDVLNIAQSMADATNKLIIGSRITNAKLGVFARLEKFFARFAFTVLHGRKVRDPWTGLWAMTSDLVSTFLGIKDSGERFAFDILINMQHLGVKCINIPVNTVDEYGSSSNFWSRALDLCTILLLPLKFVSSSIIATGVDNAIYLLMTNILYRGHWIVALTLCRSAGAVTGYLLNRNVVFKQSGLSRQEEFFSVLKFALLWGFNFGMSILLVGLFHEQLHIQNFVAKLLSDSILYTVSYTVQRELIFRDVASNKE